MKRRGLGVTQAGASRICIIKGKDLDKGIRRSERNCRLVYRTLSLSISRFFSRSQATRPSLGIGGGEPSAQWAPEGKAYM